MNQSIRGVFVFGAVGLLLAAGCASGPPSEAQYSGQLDLSADPVNADVCARRNGEDRILDNCTVLGFLEGKGVSFAYQSVASGTFTPTGANVQAVHALTGCLHGIGCGKLSGPAGGGPTEFSAELTGFLGPYPNVRVMQTMSDLEEDEPLFVEATVVLGEREQ